MTESESFQMLVKQLSKLCKLSQAEEDSVANSFTFRQFKKNEVLTSAGEVENYAYFLVDGCVRNFCLHDGHEYSLDFFFSGEFTNSYMSFLTRQASIVSVQALTSLTTLRIHYDAVQQLYDFSPTFNVIGRKISEGLYVRRTLQDLALLTTSAQRRYYDLMASQPRLIEKIPQKYLASYLGIAPETLSRLRNP